MKIVFDRNEFIDALSPALGIAPSKNTVAVIEGVLISAKKDGCYLSAVDHEKGMHNTVQAQVEEEGNYVLNAQKLSSILRTMPSGEITLEIDERNVTKITGGRSSFELHAIPGEDFPVLPDLSGEYGIKLSREELKEMISNTLFSAAQNDPRPALNGLMFHLEGETLTVVACDSNRLALRKLVCKLVRMTDGRVEVPDVIEVILPTKSLGELLKLLGASGEEMIDVRFGHKHVIFGMGGLRFFTRRIEAQYIDYEKFIPKNHRIFVTLDAGELRESLERASLVTEENNIGQAKSPLCCEFCDGVLKLTSKSVTGSFYDEIPTESMGGELLIGFNCRFLMDALRAIGDGKIRLFMTTSLMSMVIRSAEEREGSDFTYLVLPVRLNR